MSVKQASLQNRITLSEMAIRLNRSAKTFRKYVILYKIPHIKLGRDMLFDPSKVERFLESFAATEQSPDAPPKIVSKKKIEINSPSAQKDFFLRELGLR